MSAHPIAPPPATRRLIITATTLLTTALGVTVGFAWSSAVTALNRHLVEQPRYQVLFDFVWAALVTMVAVGLIAVMKTNASRDAEAEPEGHHHGNDAAPAA